MAQKEIIEAVRFLKKNLQDKGIHIIQMILVGSQARGTAREDSDIDVVIVSVDFRGKDIFERTQSTKDAEILAIRKYMIPFDILTLTPEEIESGNPILEGCPKDEMIFV